MLRMKLGSRKAKLQQLLCSRVSDFRVSGRKAFPWPLLWLSSNLITRHLVGIQDLVEFFFGEIGLLAGSLADGLVVADDLGGDHHGALRYDGVDFARHDGGARLHLGQRYLGEVRPRPGREPANIVGYLHEAYRDGF